MRKREDKGQRRLDEQQQVEDRVILWMLGISMLLLLAVVAQGDTPLQIKQIVSEGFVNKALRERGVSEKRKYNKKGRAGQERERDKGRQRETRRQEKCSAEKKIEEKRREEKRRAKREMRQREHTGQ